MRRSQINSIYLEAKSCFENHGWELPPNPRWDITDFGLGDFGRFGLVLINLAEEPEYCEKLMYARRGQTTPMHTHARKKEDIICRHGELTLELWAAHPEKTERGGAFSLRINGEPRALRSGSASRFMPESGLHSRPGFTTPSGRQERTASSAKSPPPMTTQMTISL